MLSYLEVWLFAICVQGQYGCKHQVSVRQGSSLPVRDNTTQHPIVTAKAPMVGSASGFSSSDSVEAHDVLGQVCTDFWGESRMTERKSNRESVLRTW